jgi:diadenylate cyclase
VNIISGKILGVSESANYLYENLRLNSSPLLLIDILIVAVLFYWVYIFLKETRAMRILYGLLLLLALMALGKLLNLILLNWLLKNLMTMLIVAIPIVFQPELRNALEKLGRSTFLHDMNMDKDGYGYVVNEIVTAVSMLSKQKIGALIVVARQTGLREYIDNGVPLDAKVSSTLLRSIFFPRSPLHDGAVIISGNKIISACSILPVSGQSLSINMGTRHKAGVGISEISDAIAIIVSEETGAISMSIGGKLDTKISEERLQNRLSSIFRQKNKNK